MTERDTTAENREQSCECCSTTNTANNTDATADRWLGEADPLTAELPDDLRGSLGRVLGEGPVDSLGEWIDAVRHRVGGGSIDVADLCHADGETPHRGTVGGETYQFRCFYDAVVLAALTEGGVEVRTESPGGAVIEAHSDGIDDLRVTPSGAVFSFGVEVVVEAPTGDGPTHADVYGAVCPYVRAFPDREAYEQWAGATDGATVAMPLSGATEIASALVE